MRIVGRKKEIRKIRNYATSEPENKAFFGVKGLGKSIILEEIFSKTNCKFYAEEYRYLYVRTILQPEKKGDDLTNFLLDRVINGVDLISDEVLKKDIHNKIKTESDKFHSKDSLLREALEIIKEYEYSMILVMDEFHNMGRNSAVGSEQYDFLRSLNELGLVYYWIVSDSDFSDVYATSQFTTSFFAQKFIPETIPQMREEEVVALIKQNAEKYDASIQDEDAKTIYSVIGGVPGFVVPAVMAHETLEVGFDEKSLIDYMLENPRCVSLMTSWSRSLTCDQKCLLRTIATAGRVYQNEYLSSIGKINQLGDHSGLGILIHGNDEKGKYWEINTKLYASFILSRSELFDSADIVPSKKEETVTQPAATYIQNNYYTVNNNFFSPSCAVDALLELKNAVESQKQLFLPDNHVLTSTMHQLPYFQSGWDELSDKEKDGMMDEYADGVFAADEFKADSLSESQMKRFFLDDTILANLSEMSRGNLICAIQVYDLLQFCVDKFGLNMLHSESARGILFARLYESILKENLRPAINTVSEIASREITLDRSTYLIGEAPASKMTIGSFVYILRPREVQQKLATICKSEIHRDECDLDWWNNHQNDMYNISVLRNDCCHSGNHFNATKLDKLISYLFELSNIADVVIYNEITNR